MSRSFSVFATGLAVAAVSILVGGGGVPLRADEDVPDNVRVQLEDVLRQRVSKLREEKNEAGIPFRRGTYSKSFKRVDDATFHVTFHQDTASKGRLKTERYLLTLKKDTAGKWSVGG